MVQEKKQQIAVNDSKRNEFRQMRKPRPQFENLVPQDEFEHVAVETRRVTKVTKGAKRFRFSSIVVVGNRMGKVGIGIGKGGDPKQAIDKATRVARTHLVDVTLSGATIPHVIQTSYGAATVLLKPASAGTGIIAGSSVRSVLELAGIKDIRGKIIGTNNRIANIYCTLKALTLLRDKRI